MSDAGNGTSQFPTHNGGTTEAAPSPPDKKSVSVATLTKIIVALVIAIVIALLLAYCQNNSSDDAISPVAAISDDALKAQEKCFEADLFYDAEGICYSQDISGVPDSQRKQYEVPASAEPAPGAAVPPAPAAVGAPAAPGAIATPSGSTPTSTPKTETGLTLKSYEWVLRLKADPDPSTGQPPPDVLTGGYGLRFKIDNGTVSGTQRVPNLGSKNVTMSGSFNSKLATSNLFASMENLGTISFVGQMNKNMNSISGRYTHNNGKTSVSGSFTMARNG